MLRPNNETRNINDIYERQVDVVYRVCLSYTQNKSDTEDCVSDTFMKLIKSNVHFNDEEHEKAWLIRTATNICKNHLKHWTKKSVNIDEHENYGSYDNTQQSDVLTAVRALPDKLRTPIYLYYYEGYNSVEIAKMLNKPESTIRKHLKQARELLKTQLEGTEL